MSDAAPKSQYDHLRKYANEMVESVGQTNFVVFLCGPNMTGDSRESEVRRKIRDALVGEGFTVVLGEDDGLEDVQLRIGLDAQDNELQFVARHCNSVVIVAGSPGSFCEVGLFSWHYVHRPGLIFRSKLRPSFHLLVDEIRREDKSYFRLGPAKVIEAKGKILFCDFSKVDLELILAPLRLERALLSNDMRGKRRRRNPE